jgi:hypothetical protein
MSKGTTGTYSQDNSDTSSYLDSLSLPVDSLDEADPAPEKTSRKHHRGRMAFRKVRKKRYRVTKSNSGSNNESNSESDSESSKASDGSDSDHGNSKHPSKMQIYKDGSDPYPFPLPVQYQEEVTDKSQEEATSEHDEELSSKDQEEVTSEDQEEFSSKGEGGSTSAEHRKICTSGLLFAKASLRMQKIRCQKKMAENATKLQELSHEQSQRQVQWSRIEDRLKDIRRQKKEAQRRLSISQGILAKCQEQLTKTEAQLALSERADLEMKSEQTQFLARIREITVCRKQLAREAADLDAYATNIEGTMEFLEKDL